MGTADLSTLLGVFFGAIGTYLALQAHVKELQKAARERLDAEIHRNAEGKLKEYAAQRDFQLLEQNQKEMKAAIDGLQQESNNHKQLLTELKTLSTALFNRLEGLAARLDGTTGGWRRPE